MSDRFHRASDLKAFLSRASKPADAMGYLELQGFLFAVAAAPDVVHASEWVPVVFGEDEPAFDSKAQAQRISDDLTKLYERVTKQAAANPVELPEDCRFRDDVLSNLADDAPVSQWSRGFLRGHNWLEKSWEDFPEELDEELGALLMTLSFFSSRRLAEAFLAETPGRKKSLAEMAQALRDLFPSALEGYAHMGRSIQQALIEFNSRQAETVGRNEPCPCGSGKKYKRCCLAAPADLMEQAARRVREVQGGIEPRVVRYADSICGPEALDRAWETFVCGRGDLDPEGPEEQLFHPWLLYRFIPEIRGPGGAANSRPVAQLYLDEHRARLTADEAAFLQTTSLATTSFHDVLDVESGRRVRLRDILLETEHEVFERSASETLRVGDVVYGRVVAYEGVALIVGMGPTALRPIDKLEVIRFREQLRMELGEPTRAVLFAADDRIRKEYLRLRDRLMNPVPPRFTNTDGEPLEFHTITCDVESIEAAFEALKPLAKGAPPEVLLRNADRDASGRLKKVEFSWLKKGNKKHKSWENTVLGQLVLEGGSLKAEVNSAARARRLQRELRKRLGETMRNLIVGIKPLGEAIADYEEDRETPEEEERRAEAAAFRARPEVRAAMRKIEERQWDGWLVEKIPALGGLTPRQAVRRPEGREMVEALLLQFERQRPPGDEEVYDFNRLRRKLGLPERDPAP